MSQAFLPIIGLEIHARLKTKTKLFCNCASVDETAVPNSASCVICLGHPGVLPMLNEEAVRRALRVGLALNATIPDVCYFDRKHYFYPDLPKGYQITQYKHPVVEHGTFMIEVPGNIPARQTLAIHIERAHMEEDAAKNIHQGASHTTYVDYNRAGTPLLEIVSGPDLRSPQEAKIFLQELQELLRAIGASDADMEKGMMRCDANISLLAVDDLETALTDKSPLDMKKLNPKTEIKNLNSFRSVERALQFEIERQTKLIEAGTIPQTTTRGWNDQTNETVEQRVKESEADYRYFPEPDLPPLPLSDWREEERARMPMTPFKIKQRLMEEFKLDRSNAEFLYQRQWVDWFENVVSELGAWAEAEGMKDIQNGQTDLILFLMNSVKNKLSAILDAHGILSPETVIDPENMAEYIVSIVQGKIGSTNIPKLLELMVTTKQDPSNLIEAHGLAQVQDTAFLEKIVSDVIAQNTDQTAQVKAGKLPVLKWFVGQVMKASAGKTNPASAEEELKKQLGV